MPSHTLTFSEAEVIEIIKRHVVAAGYNGFEDVDFEIDICPELHGSNDPRESSSPRLRGITVRVA